MKSKLGSYAAIGAVTLALLCLLFPPWAAHGSAGQYKRLGFAPLWALKIDDSLVEACTTAQRHQAHVEQLVRMRKEMVVKHAAEHARERAQCDRATAEANKARTDGLPDWEVQCTYPALETEGRHDAELAMTRAELMQADESCRRNIRALTDQARIDYGQLGVELLAVFLTYALSLLVARRLSPF